MTILFAFFGVFSWVNAATCQEEINKLPYDISNIDDYTTKIVNNFSSYDDVKLDSSPKGNIQGLMKGFCNSVLAA